MAKLKYKDSSGKFIDLPYIMKKNSTVLQELGESTSNTISQKVITDELEKKQEKLTSGVNIKTINGLSLLGSGNLEIPSSNTNVVIKLSSNQDDQNDLKGATIRVSIKNGDEILNQSWQGSEIELKTEPGTTYIVSTSNIDGYKTPSNEEFAAVENVTKNINLVYLSELLNVTISSDDGTDLNGRVTITVNNYEGDIIGDRLYSGNQNFSLNIPYDSKYIVRSGVTTDYIKPENKIFTANQKTRDVILRYTKIVENGEFTIQDSTTDPGSIIRMYKEDFFKSLLPKFRRCLAKSTEDNKIKICYLNDSNSNQYHDGTSANLTGSEGDVMVYFPEFWYKAEKGLFEYGWGRRLYFNSYKVDDSWHHVPANLVGVYKAGISDGKLLSYSNVTPYTTYFVSDLLDAVNKKGKGFHIIDYQQHCIIAWMFYTRYKNTNSENICGSSNSSTSIKTGTTNIKGITDTTSSEATNTSNMLVNFLGIEGCWGSYLELMEGIHGNGTNIIAYNKGNQFDLSYDQVVSIDKRKFSIDFMNGYITSMFTDYTYGDMVPYNTSDGSSSTYFCDYAEYSSGSFSQVYILRGGGEVGKQGLTHFDYFLQGSSKKIGSRLAFDGDIEVIDSPSEFKSIINFR